MPFPIKPKDEDLITREEETDELPEMCEPAYLSTGLLTQNDSRTLGKGRAYILAERL